MSRTYARVTVILAALAVPWTVLAYPDATSYVFAWGLVTADPIHVTALTEYLFVRTSGLPRHLLAWPVSVLLYGLAVGSAVVGAVWGREDDQQESSERASGEERQRRPESREDVRVTAGLLVIAGVSHATFALGLGRPGILAIPVGTVVLWGLAAVVFFRGRSRRY